MVKPYNSNADKKQEVSEMFNKIAYKYDFLNRLLSLGVDQSWRKAAVNYLKEDAPKLILDVATGTGDLAIQLAQTLKPQKIYGVDIAVDMLKIGEEKIKDKHLEQIIELREGDSEDLKFQDNYFDAITVAFGVRNYENLEKGLTEMCRVLKPKGKVVILEFTKPHVFPFKQLYHFYFKYVLPLVGKITSKDQRAYTYLYESVMAFPEREDFTDIMQRVGFVNNKYKPLTLGICSIYLGEKI